MNDPKTHIEKLLGVLHRAEGQPTPPRRVLCTRCVRLEPELRRQDPRWRPNLAARTADGNTTGLCADCAGIAATERAARAQDATMPVEAPRARAGEPMRLEPRLGAAKGKGPV